MCLKRSVNSSTAGRSKRSTSRNGWSPIKKLATHVLPSLGLDQLLPAILQALGQLEKTTAPRRLMAVAGALGTGLSNARNFDRAVARLGGHPSDIVPYPVAGAFLVRTPGSNPPMARLNVHRVESLEAPELAPYRTLRRPDEHERAGLLVATNEKVVRRLLASRFTVLSVLLTPAWFEILEPDLSARLEDIAVYLGEKEILETITGYQLHQGVLATARIPPALDLETLLDSTPGPLLIVAVEGIANAENLGTIVRSCAAFEVSFLIVGETCVSPLQRRAVSGSMGALFEQPTVRVNNLVATLERLRARGIRCFAAHPRPDARQPSSVDFKGDCCLVFGAEGPGLSNPVLAACDESLKIRMSSHMNSINVSAAAAVFLYEATQQRG